MMAPLAALQIAQILADLNSLQNTDPKAALNLLHANKTLTGNSKATILEPPQFDRLGRRVVLTPPSLIRDNSSSEIDFGFGFSGEEVDEDMRRARELVGLHRGRDRLREIGDIGLARSKERVDAVVAKQAKGNANDERPRVGKERYLGMR